MLQLEKDLLEIQLQVSKWQPIVRKIMNPLYGYVHCNYLVSNTTTYLDTNYIPNTETKLDIKFKLNTLDDNNICFSDNFGIGIRNSKLAYMFGEELVITDVDASVDAIYEVQLSKNGLFVNDLQVVERFSTSIDFVSDKTLLLGAGYDNDDVKILSSKNIYYCKVYDVDEFEYPVMEDGNMIMSVLNQVNLVDDTFESFGGTDTEIKDTLDEVMNKPKTKSNIPDLVRNYTGIRTDANIEEDYVYGFWNYADRKFHTATEGKYKGKDDIEYVELEYLQSSGTQYIDTLIKETSCFMFDFKFRPESSTYSKWQSYLSGTLDNFTIGAAENTPAGCYLRYRTSEIFFLLDNIYTTQPNTFKVMDNRCTVNSSSYTSGINTSNSVGTGSSNIFIFNNAGLSRGARAIVYYLKMYGKDGELIRDLIPVRRLSDNVLCMYDKVSETYFENSGTDTFIAGPEV